MHEDCLDDMLCDDGICHISPAPLGAYCSEATGGDIECDSPYICSNRVCVECEIDSHCGDALFCIGFECVPGTPPLPSCSGLSSTCPAILPVCIDRKCAQQAQEGEMCDSWQDEDCSPGLQCIGSVCMQPLSKYNPLSGGQTLFILKGSSLDVVQPSGSAITARGAVGANFKSTLGQFDFSLPSVTSKFFFDGNSYMYDVTDPSGVQNALSGVPYFYVETVMLNRGLTTLRETLMGVGQRISSTLPYGRLEVEVRLIK